MRSNRPSYEALIDDIYAASLAPQRWSNVIEQLAGRHGARVGVLLTPMEGMFDRYLAVTHGVDPDFQQSYGSHWYRFDPWQIAGSARGITKALTVYAGERIVPDDELVNTPFFHEFYTKCLKVRHVIGMTVFEESDQPTAPPTFLSLHRTKESGPFSYANERELRTIVPHLRRALLVHWANQRAAQALAVRDAALDSQTSAVFWIGPDARVLYANRSAQALLEQNKLLRVVNSHLVAFAVHASEPLADALRRAYAGNAVTVVLAGSQRRIAHLLPPRYLEASGTCAFGVLLQIDAATAEAPASLLHALTRLHRLTKGEVEVLRHLVEGETPKEIAEQLRVSVATVRTHLTNLFSKTSTRRQIDLVRLALAHPVHAEDRPS
jgi:DNA-binding NarL/FixJ family response regulator